MLRRFAFLLLLPLVALSAVAQRIAFYATYSLTHAGNAESGITQTANGTQNQYTTLNSSGYGGGVTLNIFRLPGLALGLDTHGATRTGIGNIDQALFGLKLSATKPLVHIKPYVGAGAGFMKTRARNASNVPQYVTPDSAFTTHYDFYQVFGGLDYPYKKVLDFRLIEVGGGSSFGMPQNISVFTVNTGVVLHF